MLLFRISPWLACIYLSCSLHAAPAVVVTLSSVGDRVRSQNPDLAAARLRIGEALGRSSQAGRLPNPELETSFEHNPQFREGKLEIGFSQRFPVTGRLRANATYCARHNTVFQGLAADGAKLALWKLWRCGAAYVSCASHVHPYI